MSRLEKEARIIPLANYAAGGSLVNNLLTTLTITYDTFSVPEADAFFGHKNWSLCGELWFFNVANTITVTAQPYVSRLLASLSFQAGTATTYTNAAGAARSIKVRCAMTRAQIITAIATAATETLITGMQIQKSGGANVGYYGVRLYVADQADPMSAAMSKVGVG